MSCRYCVDGKVMLLNDVVDCLDCQQQPEKIPESSQELRFTGEDFLRPHQITGVLQFGGSHYNIKDENELLAAIPVEATQLRAYGGTSEIKFEIKCGGCIGYYALLETDYASAMEVVQNILFVRSAWYRGAHMHACQFLLGLERDILGARLPRGPKQNEVLRASRAIPFDSNSTTVQQATNLLVHEIGAGLTIDPRNQCDAGLGGEISNLVSSREERYGLAVNLSHGYDWPAHEIVMAAQMTV